MNLMKFNTYVKRYILDLTKTKNFSISRFFNESKQNKRLVDPLELYCALEKKKLDNPELIEHEKWIIALITSNFNYAAFPTKSYAKIYDSYINYLNQNKYDCITKISLRNKILRIQADVGITTYRIYTDLKLNPGNTNAFLKNCDIKKLSLKDTQNILSYLSDLENKN